MSNGKRKADPNAATRPLKPVKNPHVHDAKEEITVEVHSGKVSRTLVCECGQRALLWRGTIEGFHKPEPIPGVVVDE